jgi:hypothetical protein
MSSWALPDIFSLAYFKKRDILAQQQNSSECQLAEGGLLVKTDPPLAFNEHGCVESGLGLVNHTAICCSCC